VARLGGIDADLSNRALEWLNENQLPDGSWGAPAPNYYHDRVISTLAAMIALTHRGRRAYDRQQIDKGLLALENITSGATKGLSNDPNGATVGFEMIAPTLVTEAEKLGIIKQQGERILGRLGNMRKIKMQKMKGYKINRNVTMAFSAEMAGTDGRDMLEVESLQESNGSVANSPSATAYFATYLRPGDTSAINYLKSRVLLDGGVPDFAPIDVFEIAWCLWNLNLIPLDNKISQALIQLNLDMLITAWNPKNGIGTCSRGTIRDSDDTAVVFDVFSQFGTTLDIQAILHYEEKTHFRCFSLEANPSLSANIHVLGALRRFGYDLSHSAVQKILNLLRVTQSPTGYWLEKWHSSPYYATSHAILACAGCDDSMVQKAIQWILETQNPEGAWGHYGFPTQEETAYCLQALLIWKRLGGRVDNERIKLGRMWLVQHGDESCKPLWIGKGLYCPELVVHSAVLSALSLSRGD